MQLPATALALLACLALPLAAAAEGAPDYAGTTLTGDWNGTRSELWQRGVALEAGFKFDSLRNRGGARDGGQTVTHLELKMRADLEKLLGWNNALAYLSTLTDGGAGINARRTGSLMGVSNLEVPVQTTRLFQAWLQQSLLDDKLALLAGLYPIDSEFFTVDSAGIFLGPQYGTPADLALTNAPSIFNNSAFGIRARWNVASSLYAMGAVLDGVPNDPARPKRTAIRFAKGDGSFTIGEFGWQPEAANDKFKGHAKVALGLWGYSTKVDDLRDLNAAGNPMARSRRGGYVLGERTLLRLGGDNDRFLTGFARYTFGDGDSTAIKHSLNLGVHVKSPFASRPDDIMGLAWTRAGLADKWRSTQAATTVASETALEITYRYSVNPWFAIQPNYQHIRNPGGTTATRAKLLGARIELTL